MREIKFRAWDKIDKKIRMITNFNFYDELVLLDETASGKVIKRREEDVYIMQFTGLHDKNGKEIYEGDILRNGHGSSVVKFEDGMFVVADYKCELWRFSGSNKEVIGNIYENPDLLKGE